MEARLDGNSELVAELVTVNGFKAAYAIKDGADGPRGWMETSDDLAVTLGIATATGLGVLAISEIATILQLLGSAALIQFASKKLLFAEDRKQTLQEVDEFLNTKVAPKELVDEIKQIGKALLPSSTNNKALAAPTEKSPEPATVDTTVLKAEATPDTIFQSKVDAVTGPTPEINSVPKTQVKAESLPRLPKPLSPYPYYPDFKPPTSPTPSQP